MEEQHPPSAPDVAAPDPRFSLANERTFLAWIRTALAFLAASVGVRALGPTLGPQPVRVLIAGLAVAGAAVIATTAWSRWRAVERALRAGRPVPPPWTGLLVAIVTAGLAVGLVVGAVV